MPSSAWKKMLCTVPAHWLFSAFKRRIKQQVGSKVTNHKVDYKQSLFFLISQFVSNIFPQGLRNALETNISQVTCRRVRNKEYFSCSKKITKREQRTIETLIKNYMAKERAFYCLNQQFVSNITRDIFSTRSSEHFGNKHLANDLLTRAKQRNFPQSKK